MVNNIEHIRILEPAKDYPPTYTLGDSVFFLRDNKIQQGYISAVIKGESVVVGGDPGNPYDDSLHRVISYAYEMAVPNKESSGPHNKFERYKLTDFKHPYAKTREELIAKL